jgi:hypothetical protein
MSTKDFDTKTREAAEEKFSMPISPGFDHVILSRREDFTAGANLRKPEWSKVCRKLEYIIEHELHHGVNHGVASEVVAVNLIAELKASGCWIPTEEE